MRTFSNLIDNRELLDFSQNFNVTRNYIGSTLFPDRKTQYIEAEYTRLTMNGNLPMIAMVHSFDTEAHVGSRIPFEKAINEELLIKEKINLTEEIRILTHGMSMDTDSLRRYIFDDVARMAERVVARAEKAKMDAISHGKMVIIENGLNLEVDYGIPTDQFVNTDWTDHTNADILGDVRKWRLICVAKGYTPNIAVTTETVVTNIMYSTQIQKAIFGTSGTGILPTLAQINTLFQSQFGLTINVNEERYGTITTASDAVSVTQNRFFPEAKFVMMTTGMNGTVGAGLWGVTPEEDAQGGAFDSKREMQYVTCTTWDTPDPVATWTKATGLMVPVLPNPYGHIIATVDGTEG